MIELFDDWQDAAVAYAVETGGTAWSVAPDLRVCVEEARHIPCRMAEGCRLVIQRSGMADMIEPCGSVPDGIVKALRLVRCAGIPPHPALRGRPHPVPRRAA